VKSAGEVELARHTQESARRLLEALVSADGYTTEVVFSGAGKEAGTDTESGDR